jgi:hypothetical protein
MPETHTKSAAGNVRRGVVGASSELCMGEVLTLQFSAVIPAFNAEATLPAAIASARQCGAAEIVVVDDGSTDRTSALAGSLGTRVLRIGNGGAANARRVGAEAATTDAIIFLDADDQLVAEGVSESLRLLAGDSELIAVLGGVEAVRANGTRKTLQAWRSPLIANELVRRGYAPVPPAAVVWRRRSVTEAMFGDEPPALWPAYAEDYELLIRGSVLGTIAIHGRKAAIYRLSGGKSDQRPIAAATAARDIAEHYASALGIRHSARSDASVRCQAFIRRATTRSGGVLSPLNMWLFVKAFASDPVFFVRWATSCVLRVSRRLAKKLA